MFWHKGSARFFKLLVASSLLVACGAAGTSPQSSTDTALTAGGDGGSSNAGASTGRKLQVVATTSIIGDLAKNVGSERVDVRVLLPPGTDPHTYSPTPSDVQAISEAHVLFENGLGLEDWLEELVANAGGSRPTVVVSEGLPTLASAEHEEHGTGSEHTSAAASAETDAHDQEGAGNDPHMWLDVQNTIGYVENIRDGLKQVDAGNVATYDNQAAAYITQLKELDATITQQVATIPADQRKLVTNHDNFAYFAKRYGFTVVGNVFENVSTEQEPSAQQIAQLVQLIREQNVPAAFTENTVNPRLAEQVANEAGIKVVTDLYTDALGEAGSNGDTYIKMMQYNVQQIVAALQ
ncbi:MAG: zinc ABC transporter substrate-binding protein [Chloroflexota bacterium]|nr:zinc ABC transporter substrate-binding protein [Chloroflexota bacterium]